MALVRNLRKTDRTLRILIGARMGAAAVLFRSHLFGAIGVGLAAQEILVEGAIGH